MGTIHINILLLPGLGKFGHDWKVEFKSIVMTDNQMKKSLFKIDRVSNVEVCFVTSFPFHTNHLRFLCILVGEI